VSTETNEKTSPTMTTTSTKATSTGTFPVKYMSADVIERGQVLWTKGAGVDAMDLAVTFVKSMVRCYLCS